MLQILYFFPNTLISERVCQKDHQNVSHEGELAEDSLANGHGRS